MKLTFMYLAQEHQVPHSLPLAAEVALADPTADVHVCTSTNEQEAVARRLARLYPGARLSFDRLRVPALARWIGKRVGGVPVKAMVLAASRDYLSGFDAIVVPERTSLLLKRLGVTRPALVWTSHGAGDRAISYASDIARFDYVMLAGVKQEQRMTAEQLIHPGRYHVGCYPKFDLLKRGAQTEPRYFHNGKPTVLYVPHFRSSLSSWPRDGYAVLDWFAKQRDYNLIFAPHLRLFQPLTAAVQASFDRYRRLDHMRIDLGSEHSIDMSYPRAADIYLGDVSSQVGEFLVSPRPCVFLNSHGVDWAGSPDYLFWKLGPVIEDVGLLPAALLSAQTPHWQQLQREYVTQTFGVLQQELSTKTSALALLNYLRSVGRRPLPPLPARPGIGHPQLLR